MFEEGGGCSIQVKTRRDIGSDGGWHRKAKHENIRSDSLFYCFVDFGKTTDARPTVYVLPSARVAEVLFTAHRKWLANPGKRGQQDSAVRRRVPDYTRYIAPSENPYPKGWLDQYRDARHLLHLETGDVERKEEPC